MKTKKKRSRNIVAWTGQDHQARDDKLHRQSSMVSKHLRAVLTHGTDDKKHRIKLQLSITQIKRKIEALKKQLTAWDPSLSPMNESDPQMRDASTNPNKPADDGPPHKKVRKGQPETWKLKGAARPAELVYDFDTRYIDPYQKAHQLAHEKTRRSINLLAVYSRNITEAPPTNLVRQYLASLNQLGHLSVEMKQYKAARQVWLECLQLEGNNPLSTARDSLMQMYLEQEMFEEAMKLGRELDKDPSVWIRYGALFASRKLNNQQNDFLYEAVSSNPLTAYYLAFHDVFAQTFELHADLHNSDEQPQSSLEEAIEFCHQQGARWSEMAGELRTELQAASLGGHSKLSKADVDWKGRLAEIEVQYEEAISKGGNGRSGVDIQMYAKMFSTAMEMVEETSAI